MISYFFRENNGVPPPNCFSVTLPPICPSHLPGAGKQDTMFSYFTTIYRWTVQILNITSQFKFVNQQMNSSDTFALRSTQCHENIKKLKLN